jgi:putative ABC transport system permease protein
MSPSRVAILSSTVARAIFGERDAIGETVFAAGDWRTVVGVLGAGRSPDSDRLVLVPFPTLDLSLGEGDDGEAVQEIVMHVAPDADAVRTASAIRSWVASTFGDQAGSIDVIVPRTLLETRLRAERSFHLLLLAIGTLALAVSAIGIMNIMVASVTERATEIGVRRAFGATRRAIVRQFALEAALLGSVGGMVGVPVGLSAALVTARIAAWPIAVTAPSVLLALGLAVVAGLAASIYPARLAASITPIEAIRLGT